MSTQDETPSQENTPSSSHAPRLPIPVVELSASVQDSHVPPAETGVPPTPRQSSIHSTNLNQQSSDI